MKKIMLMCAASAIAAGAAVVAIAPPSVAQDNAKLDQLKSQGFARVAIANEPPYTAVAADGRCRSSA